MQAAMNATKRLSAIGWLISAMWMLNACAPHDQMPDGMSLEGVPALSELTLVNLEPNFASQADCSPETFKKLQEVLIAHGYSQWMTFKGIVGSTSDKPIIPFTKYPLLFSFKYENGAVVQKGLFRPVVVYDPKKEVLYFIK